MASGDGHKTRRRGAGDCTNDDDDNDGERDHNKRCRVAAGSMGNAGHCTGNHIDGGDGGEDSDGTGEDYIYEDVDDIISCDGDGDGDDGDDDGSVKVDGEQKYVFLTEDDVRARQEADTAEVAEVLSIPAGFAAALLRHLKWQPGRVQEEWFSDDRRLRAAVGLPPHGAPVATARSTRRLTCAICFDGHDTGRTRSAACATHFYCDECWRGYLHAAVGDGAARCLSLRCPDPSCSAAVVRELVDEVADDADKALYARLSLRSYVEDGGGRIRWCPAPGCALAVKLAGDAAAADVVCRCKHGFCFRCGEDPHRPVSCDTVRAWLLKNSSDLSETANWALANTKHCPACRRPIEKDQGCMHMMCPCGHDFCWLCLDRWDDHRGCEAFRAAAGDGAAGAEDERPREARAALDRYLYHYERWAANRASLRRVSEDVAALEASELGRMAFLTAAYAQIADGRRVLQWTYAYGYYLDPARDGKKRALFEDLQDQANSRLEQLHGCVELERREIFGAGGDAAVVAELLGYYRKRVENLTVVTRTFLGNLVKAFETTELPEFKSLS
ncbi:hypothetical protein ACP4OV_002003 [Aristida adscensionis]